MNIVVKRAQKTLLKSLKPGQGFRMPEGERKGFLLYVNECRARVRTIDRDEVTQEPIVLEQDWGPTTEVVALDEHITLKRMEDIQMGVKVAKKPTTAKAAVASANGKDKKERKGIKGKTQGLNIQKSWVYAFTQPKWTDEQISKFMKSEFPERKSKIFEPNAISGLRAQYNGGRLTGGVVPKVKAVQYKEPKEK